MSALTLQPPLPSLGYALPTSFLNIARSGDPKSLSGGRCLVKVMKEGKRSGYWMITSGSILLATNTQFKCITTYLAGETSVGRYFSII